MRIIQICDEWFESHTSANCENNTHIHTFNADLGGSDGVVIKQEPPVEMESIQIDELLNVKDDVNLNDFGEIFTANLSTGFEVNEINTPQYSCQNDTIEGWNLADRTVGEVAERSQERSKGFQCQFCDQILKSRFRLDCHIQSYHNAGSQTRCKHCNQHFESFDCLDKHLRRCSWNRRKRTYMRRHPHRPIENFTCDICGSTVKKFRTLLDHMNEVHSNKSTFKCRICERLYPNRYYLTKHLNRHKQVFENRPASIAINDDMDKDLIERRKYVRIHPHRPKRNFTCDICGRTIKRFEMMEEHMSSMHSARDTFRCRICGRVYPNRYYLSKHMHRHKSAKGNGLNETIEDLDKGLMERNKYNRLNPIQREEGLSCSECGKVFKHHYLMMEHKSSRHSGESTFQCRKCDRFYPNRYYLTKHLKRHEEAEKNGIPFDQLAEDLDAGLMERNKYVRAERNERKSSYNCDDCGITFKKFCLLTEHRRSKHSVDNGFRCYKCGRSYPSRYYLTKHLKRHTETDTMAVIEFNDKSSECDNPLIEPFIPTQYQIIHASQPKAEFTCDFCGLVYGSYDLLTEHMVSNHSDSASFICNICNGVYPNRFCLEKHMKQHQQHQEPQKHHDNHEVKAQEIVRSEEQFIANNLDENLVEREKYIRAHPHRPLSNITCDICQKVLRSYYSLKEHMLLKHSSGTKGKHSCPLCKKLFASKKRVEKHKELKHPDGTAEEKTKWKAGPKQMCSVCGRLFPDKSKMIAHEKTHFGIMTSCEICGKKFLHKHYLRKHIKSVHSNHRPFGCNIDGCNWSFAYPQCLKRHQARKHGMVTNRNECPICGKDFPDSTYHLKRHLKAHANNTAKEYIPGVTPKGHSREKKIKVQ